MAYLAVPTRNTNDTNSFADINQLQTNISSRLGTIRASAHSSPEADELECDGSAISRSTYSDLFTKIGTTWGVGDGSSTFNIPDLRGAFLRGTGSHGSETMADSNPFAGPSLGAFENDQLQGHRMNKNPSGLAEFNLTVTGGGNTYGAGYPNYAPATNTTTGDPVTDGSNGTPRTGDETRPFNAGVKFYIKVIN